MKKSIYLKPTCKIHVLHTAKNYGLGTGSPNVDDPDDVLSRQSNPWPTGDDSSTGTGSTGGNGAWTEW